MARKRQIKPDYQEDEETAKLSPWARLLEIFLWCHLDRDALIEDSPRLIRSRVFPLEDHSIQDIEKWIDELCSSDITTVHGEKLRRLYRLEWQGKPLLYCPRLIEEHRVYDDEPQRFNVPRDVLESVIQSGSVPSQESILLSKIEELEGKLAEFSGQVSEPTEDPRGTREESEGEDGGIPQIDTDTEADKEAEAEVGSGSGGVEPARKKPKSLHPLGELWNEHCGKLAKIRGIAGDRAKSTKARWDDRPDPEYWAGVIKKIAETPFCNGTNRRGWRATFDFLIQPNTHNKVLEGQYEDWDVPDPPPGPQPVKLRTKADIIAENNNALRAQIAAGEL